MALCISAVFHSIAVQLAFGIPITRFLRWGGNAVAAVYDRRLSREMRARRHGGALGLLVASPYHAEAERDNGLTCLSRNRKFRAHVGYPTERLC
jgi:hypothetical protein